MSWDFCKTKTVKRTNTDHRCEYCGRIIPKGSKKILNWSGKWDGELVNSYACHWCVEHDDRLTDELTLEILDFWDCLYEDIFHDKIQELRKNGNCIVIDFDKEDPDWLVFIDDVTGEIVHREYMPVVNK
jgi:hypothetical protein